MGADVIVLGIDPGPETCGLVEYVSAGSGVWSVTYASAARSVDETVGYVLGACSPGCLVACERVQSYGIAGASLLQTAEVYGRLQQATLGRGLRWVGLYRREVLSALDVAGKGSRDAVVRQRMIEAHGGPGCEKKGGPLAMVSGHAWQALAAAYVGARREACEGREVRAAGARGDAGCAGEGDAWWVGLV